MGPITLGWLRRIRHIGDSLGGDMFKEHDVIALTAHIPFHVLFDVDANGPLSGVGGSDTGLIPGDVGTIIHIYPQDKAFMVEFLTSDGEPVAIADVLPSQARSATKYDLATARFRKTGYVKAKASTTTKAKNVVRVRA